MKKSIWLNVVFILIALSAGTRAGGQDARPPAAEGQPRAVSLIPELELTEAAVRGRILMLEVKNNSALGVVAVAVTYKSSARGRGFLIRDGLLSSEGASTVVLDVPKVVMPPGRAKRFSVHLSNMEPGAAAEVSGVIYADGTEAGRDSTLKLIHSLREESRAEQHRRTKSPQ